jgi:hypothetical protein
MVKLPEITGINHPHQVTTPCKGMIAAMLGVLFLALLASVPLAAAGVARVAAYQSAEARI